MRSNPQEHLILRTIVRDFLDVLKCSYTRAVPNLGGRLHEVWRSPIDSRLWTSKMSCEDMFDDRSTGMFELPLQSGWLLEGHDSNLF
jgi:hypothetical protein